MSKQITVHSFIPISSHANYLFFVLATQSELISNYENLKFLMFTYVALIFTNLFISCAICIKPFLECNCEMNLIFCRKLESMTYNI